MPCRFLLGDVHIDTVANFTFHQKLFSQFPSLQNGSQKNESKLVLEIWEKDKPGK